MTRDTLLVKKQGRVWIYEPRSDGHRLDYVSLLVDHLRAANKAHVVVTTRQVLDSVEWRSKQSLRGVTICETVGRRLEPDLLRRVRDDGGTLVIPDGDKHLARVVLSPRALPRTRLLVMRGHPQPGIRANFVFAAKLLVVAFGRLRRQLTLLSLEATHHTQERSLQALGVRAVLDPVTLRPLTTAREDWKLRMGLAETTEVVAVIGDLSERKSIMEVLQAWDQSLPSSRVLALVGTPSESARLAFEAHAARHPANYFLRLEYVSDEEFDGWIQVADCVLMAYTDEASSGVLLKCAAAGTPVIVAGSRLVRAIARELEVPSILVPEIGVESLRLALGKIGRLGRTSAGTGERLTFAAELLGRE